VRRCWLQGLDPDEFVEGMKKKGIRVRPALLGALTICSSPARTCHSAWASLSCKQLQLLCRTSCRHFRIFPLLSLRTQVPGIGHRIKSKVRAWAPLLAAPPLSSSNLPSGLLLCTPSSLP